MAVKPREPKESEIQLAICDYLALKRYFFWRQNTTSVFDATKKVFRALPKYAMRGVPDICVLWNGKFIGLEVKRPKGKQSEGQIEFELGSKKAGAEYYVVTSLDDVRKVL